MFKIGTGRTAWISVKWKGLTEEGREIDNEIDVKVDLVARSRLNAQLEAERIDPEVTIDFAQEVTKGWRKVGDKEGTPLPFNADNFAQLLESPGFSAGWGTAYLKAWQGISGLREKNSATSPAVGSAEAGQSNPTQTA